MDDTLQTDPEFLALELGKLLDEHNGGEVVVMDMRSLNFWTDYFIIATVTSNTHLMGLERHIKEFVREKELEILRRSRKPVNDAGQGSDEWCLLDLGTVVIHLMTARSRSFFELERLWNTAPLIYGTGGTRSEVSVPLTHSSKSS